MPARKPESNCEAQLITRCSRRLKTAFRRLANTRLKSEAELLRELAEREIADERAAQKTKPV